MKLNRTILFVFLLVAGLCGPAYAEVHYADSGSFSVDLLAEPVSASTDSSDSGEVPLNLRWVNRGWADSNEFGYMWAEATVPPDPNVLQLNPAGQLKFIDPCETSIYPNRSTVVLTHGWNPDYPWARNSPGEIPDWVEQMGNSMLGKGWASNHNILWWDWVGPATSKSPVGAANKADRQGNALAEELLSTLGTDYNEKIHFIGHGLGTLVNRYAVDRVHWKGWHSENTHVTLLDSVEIGDWAQRVPIPDKAVWIDNYISVFGDLHPEAVNVILREGMPFNVDMGESTNFHRYPCEWYDKSVQNPESSQMGHLWSFENEGLFGAPPRGRCYAQTRTTGDSEMNLEVISWLDAKWYMGGRTIMIVGQGLQIVYKMIEAPIKYLGDVIVDVTVDKLAAIFREASSSYMWIPIEIPEGMDLLSFDYRFSGTSDGDYMTVSIGDKQVFALEAEYVNNVPDFTNTSYIDISDFRGKSIELLIAFNSDDISGGVLEVENFRFHCTTVKQDLNIDGRVDFMDYSELGNNWGKLGNVTGDICGPNEIPDSIVNGYDLEFFSKVWLRDANDPNTW